MQGGDDDVVEALRRADLDSSGLDDKHKALLSFVEVVTKEAYKTKPETIDSLKSFGWSDEQIAETVFVTGMFALFNRVADAFGLEDPEFIEMKKQGLDTPIPAEKYD